MFSCQETMKYKLLAEDKNIRLVSKMNIFYNLNLVLSHFFLIFYLKDLES